MGVANQFLPDDFAAIKKLIWDELRFFRRYTGQVMAVNEQKIVMIHSDEYGTQQGDPTTWLPAKSGCSLFDSMVPRVGAYLDFGFHEGVPTDIRYYAYSPAYFTGPVQYGKNYIYVFQNTSILHDIDLQKLIIKNGSQTIVLNTLTQKLTISDESGNSIELSDGEMNIDSPTLKLNGINWIHIHKYRDSLTQALVPTLTPESAIP